MSMKKMNHQRRQPPVSGRVRKRYGAPAESSERKRPRSKRGKRIFAILSINAMAIAQIFLHCTILNHNIQHSNSLIPNSQPPLLSTLSTRRRNRGILRPLTILSTASISKEEGVVSKKTSFASSVKINYRPSNKYNKDLKTHEEQERLHLDWMVRNTALVLGEDAVPPGQMTTQLIKITHSLMKAWARRAAVIKSSDAPYVVEKMLQRLLLEKRIVEEAGDVNPAKEVEIQIGNYNAVLNAWSNSDDPISADRAEQILLKMEEEKEPKPDRRSYNAVIKAFVKNGDRRSVVDKVEELVLRMEATNDITIIPDRRSYNLLLYALNNSNRDEAAEKATRYLEGMIFRYQNSTANERIACPVQPDTNSFNQVIGAWARGKTPDYLVRMEKVYDLLLELAGELEIQPNADTYNTLMGGWLKSNDENALSKIQGYFATMEEDYKNGNKLAQPDRVAANTLQTALNRFSGGSIGTKQLNLHDEYDIPRNTISQNLLIEKIIKSGVSDAPEQAQGILVDMEKSFRNGQLEMQPDECSYSITIKAFVTYKRRNAERKAEEILDRMWYLHRTHQGKPPNIRVYNAVLNAYATRKSSRSSKKAKDLLGKMESGATKFLPKPNLITYNIVMKAMKNGNKEEGAIIAENILSRLECLGRDDPQLLPDNFSYTSVIGAYGRSALSQKAEKALEIVQRMIEANKNGNEGAGVTQHTFNAAINACAFVNGSIEEKARAFEIATILDGLRLESGELADDTWYGTMLRACSCLLPPSDERRENLVNRCFREACENGCVGPLVLRQLKFAANREQQILLLNKTPDDDGNIELDELPRDWTRNNGE